MSHAREQQPVLSLKIPHARHVTKPPPQPFFFFIVASCLPIKPKARTEPNRSIHGSSSPPSKRPWQALHLPHHNRYSSSLSPPSSSYSAYETQKLKTGAFHLYLPHHNCTSTLLLSPPSVPTLILPSVTLHQSSVRRLQVKA